MDKAGVMPKLWAVGLEHCQKWDRQSFLGRQSRFGVNSSSRFFGRERFPVNGLSGGVLYLGNKLWPAGRNCFCIGLPSAVIAAEPGAVPVVERLLAAPVALGGLSRLGLPKQGFSLTALHPLQKKFLAQISDFFFCCIDSWHERGGVAACCACLLEAGEPLWQLAGSRAGLHQAAAQTISLESRRHGVLQSVQLAQRRLQN